MRLRREKERFVSLRSDRRITGKTDGSQKISFTFYVDESLVADLKLLHIKPSVVLDRELRREVRRRKRILKEKAKSQIVNRFSGQVLTNR